MALVEIKVILDFMCPWSFIGLRSMQLARERYASQLNFAVEFVPFEYDAPGKYPPDAWHISAVETNISCEDQSVDGFKAAGLQCEKRLLHGWHSEVPGWK